LADIAAGGPPTVAELLRHTIRDVADFPRPGILFRDITPVLTDAVLLRIVVNALADSLHDLDVEVELVAGIEARGFLLAGALAQHLEVGLLAVRKAGKLPPPTLRRSYELEYGSAELEIPVDSVAGRTVLLVDDVLATGGTMRAAAELVTEAGGTVLGMSVVLEIGALGGRAALDGLPELAALLTV
jgi:adenine phosphoribosyltransferase